jgi:hypothetical protein
MEVVRIVKHRDNGTKSDSAALRWKRSNAMPMLFWFPTIVMSEMCSMAWREMLFVKQDAPMPLHRATDALSNETAPSLEHN